MIQDSEEPGAGGAPLRDFDFAGLAEIAMQAVCRLWSSERQSFRQSSIDEDDGLRPTVTFRCTEVLLAISAEHPELLRGRESVIEAAMARMARIDPDSVGPASTLHYEPFTFALLTLATARLALSESSEAASARERLPGLLERLQSALPAENLRDFHPFVREHALRAALACEQAMPEERLRLEQYIGALRTSVARACERLLAHHHAGLITPAESVVLVFCASALSGTGVRADSQMALAALSAAASAQDASGSWPLGRVVRTEPSRLEISTYEVAWAMTDALTRLLLRLDGVVPPPEADAVLDAIVRASSFATRSLMEAGESERGWASDHPYEQPRIESWTSAIVLQFVLAVDRLRSHLRNREVLRSFNAISPSDPSWPGWLRWDSLATDGEPDSAHPIYDYLRRRVIEPIEAHPQQLPSGERETASVLLFGPPGTSKTTIVKAVADRLGWPIVFLSPGSFIEQGLEAIEATAKSVFARLQELRQAVVIFDECDELFRDRSPEDKTEQVRNISAFVTASMLPKLQDLHDRGKVITFVCTNHVDMMDSAVLRGGRMDHRIGVGPPDEAARERIIAKTRGDLPQKQHLDEALRQLALDAERFSRGELRRAALKLANGEDWADAQAAAKAARSVIQDMKDALTISEEAMSAFEEQQRKWSHPYLESPS